MSCSLAPDSIRLVGDPVDVVSGACVEVNWEFELRGPFPFVFRRHYDSTKRHRTFPLGLGHSHEYDCNLAFDVDGISYTTAVAAAVRFPPLLHDRERASVRGYRLIRTAALEYRLHRPDGVVAEFAFHSPDSGARLQVLRRGADSIRFTYDDYGRLASIIDAVGRSVRVDSDASGRIVGLVLISGAGRAEKPLLRFSYDHAGHLVQGVDSHGNSFGFEYDQRGRLIRKTDRRGYSFIYEYDDADRCVHSSGSDGLHEVRLRYLPEERVTIVTKADGGQWTYLYDEQGNVTRILDPYGGARSFEIDEHGRVAREIDPNGNAFENVYDANGAKLGRRSPFGELLRDPNVAVVPTARPHRVPSSPIEWEYGDLPPRKTSNNRSLDASPGTLRSDIRTVPPEQTREDAVNGAVHAEGNRTFDLTGLRIHEHQAGFPPRRWLYDAGANTRQYRDHDGCIHAYEYSSWDLRAAYSDPLGNTTRYTHTNAGEIASVTDALGTVSEYEYDLKNRVSAVRRRGEFRDQYRYDEADNLVEKLDRAGDWLLRFDIGPGNAKVARHLASGGTHTFEYDARGRFIKAATGEHQVTFDYDPLGQRTVDERDGLGVRHAFRGPRSLIRTTILGKFDIHYRHAADGSVGVIDPSGGSHRIEFPGAGLVRRILSNGSREITRFDPNGRCRSRHLEHDRGRRSWTRSYDYSGEGDLLAARDDSDGQTLYRYDATHRLQSVVRRDGSVEHYRFDAAGNLLEMPGLSDVWLADGNRLGGANRETFEYDLRDHMAQRSSSASTTRYSYDSRDLLVAAERDTATWLAAYDSLGRRVCKRLGDRTTTFYWDTDRLAAELGYDGRLRVYIYPDAFSLVPMLFVDYESVEAEPRSGRRYFPFYNHLSTPFRVEDDEGAVVWRASVEPYGRTEVTADSVIDFALRFPGHYYDHETGLHYNRFRYYDPTVGRYLQSDPLGIAGGVNLYSYARGNPLSRVDTRGNCPSGADDPESRQASPEEGDDQEGIQPKPTVSMGPDTYRATDPENPRFAASGYLRDGELELAIRSRLEDGTRSSAIRGREQFDAIMDHFGDDVDVIKGSWSYGDNLAGFNKAVAGGLSPEDAARQTWTAEQAARHGYTNVEVHRTYGPAGQYDKVEVLFTRP